MPVHVSAAVFIEDSEGRLLLVKQAAEQKRQKWGPPAGGMHAFENPIETAIRETGEEIGLEVELIDLIGIYTVKRGPDNSGIGFVFRGRTGPGKVNRREGEIKNIKYFFYKEIQKLIKIDSLYKPEYNLLAIADWRAGKSFPLEVVR